MPCLFDFENEGICQSVIRKLSIDNRGVESINHIFDVTWQNVNFHLWPNYLEGQGQCHLPVCRHS